eukprot:GFYU01006178.1.p2 GENE.GFYU01006178.1~~GFYU01006178.1.p2  ORF type:complete len:124 (+),score=5.64 GFYU01006178.1:510-881(+)
MSPQVLDILTGVHQSMERACRHQVQGRYRLWDNRSNSYRGLISEWQRLWVIVSPTYREPPRDNGERFGMVQAPGAPARLGLDKLDMHVSQGGGVAPVKMRRLPATMSGLRVRPQAGMCRLGDM